MRAELAGHREQVASGFPAVAKILHLPQAWIGDFLQGLLRVAPSEVAGVEDRRHDTVVDGFRVGGHGLVQHAHGAVGDAVAVSRPALLEDASEQGVPLGIVRVPVFGEQFDSRLAVVDELGGHRHFLAVVGVGHVGEPCFLHHGLGRVERVGGALPCSRLAEFPHGLFRGYGGFQGTVVESVLGEPVIGPVVFRPAGQVPQQPLHMVDLAAHVSRQILVGGHRFAAVRACHDEVAETFGRFGRVPRAEQPAYQVEVHVPHAVEADGQRLHGLVHMVGHGRCRRDDPFGERVSLGFEPVGVGLLQRVQLVQARVRGVRVEHAQVLFGVEPAVGFDEPVVRLVEVPDALGHGLVVGLRVAFAGEQPFGPVAQAQHGGHALVAAVPDAGVRGHDLPVHVAVPDVAVLVDRVPHGRLPGRVGDDDGLVGAFAEPVVQADAVGVELAGEDAFDVFAQSADVVGAGDVDLRAERSRSDGHGARHVFGVLHEQPVGVDALAEFDGVHPCGVHVRQRLVAFAQNEDVGDHLGAGLAAERLPGQTACGYEFGLAGQFAAHACRVLVERVPAGEHGDEASRTHRVETVPDEPVVDDGVVDADRVAVRHVADGEVERALGQSGPFHPVGDDVVVRAQVACDAGADRVGLDAGEPVG